MAASNMNKKKLIAVVTAGVVVAALAVAEVVFGSVYLRACYVNGWIPIYLIAVGLSTLLFLLPYSLTGIWKLILVEERKDEELIKTKKRPTETSAFRLLTSVISILFFLAMVAWFIAGNVWVWSTVKALRSSDGTDETAYCHPTLLVFSQTAIILRWIITVVVAATLWLCLH